MSAGTKRISNGDNTTATEETNDVDTAIVDGGPGLVYMPFVVMEDLLDKLKLLNYEEVSQPNFFQTCIHTHYLLSKVELISELLTPSIKTKFKHF